MTAASPKKTVLIRADAGGLLGSGHIMRMIALAQALRQRDIKAVFISVLCHPSMRERLQKEGFRHVLIEDAEVGDTRDAQQTIALAKELGGEWIVLDGYHFDLPYQKQVRTPGFKVAVMEDNDHCEEWYADLIVNQNLGTEGKVYQNTLTEGKALTGCHFTLLREEFQAYPEREKAPAWPPKRILVTMGGVDSDDATGLILRSLEVTELTNLEVKVIVGGGNPNEAGLQKAAAKSKHRVELLVNVTDMPSLYQWADAAITAGGSTCYEWMRYGLPAAVVTIANNQEPIVEALIQKEAALSLGKIGHLNETAAAKQLQEWFKEAPRAATNPLVDAHGARRVAAYLDTKLIISIASAKDSWINPSIKKFIQTLSENGHEVVWVHNASEAPPSDILFLLSYWKIVSAAVRAKHAHTLVVHGSDLPRGRGWSPATWQILEGCNRIPMCLLEAADAFDTGDIYLRTQMKLRGDELIDEIREEQTAATFRLCEMFIDQYPAITTRGIPQEGSPSEYPRRRPKDSELDPEQSIAEQFNRLRVADNETYPAFFKHNGHCYTLKIERMEAPE
ncbi:UDP-2,4-diacetamido-2,4,6-trideoxy-beta-L-altropyranose hydrolase [Coraliomargarita sinensis]|uniref:UDP-2,4-diacetamido-2,4, 6-trideoxy-beta-L-altropyranose hydrolase n=1 Tax=Coraliomargarita sinensis TaxID=2174842 RepID=A0A317ZJ37_9BACT|nr:UDP-2,4-diacetamido-2,4,6-trideoxy-beta-L-altropyranose hydrolase [Coraliomargarita sinensis]PXA05560.1 UDP-2,4-diacetamido-2,4,6-trideoxy-beta-L-altropyranose hydrolase [Coraliomargarita sinensis]